MALSTQAQPAGSDTYYFDCNLSDQGSRRNTCHRDAAIVYCMHTEDEYHANYSAGEDLGHLGEEDIFVAYVDWPGLVECWVTLS